MAADEIEEESQSMKEKLLPTGKAISRVTI